MQCIISKIRAYLTLQPIKQQEAEELDRTLAGRIHEILRFPFRFNTEILNIPIANNGFDFPSIARLNATLAIEGLVRDLNHHIPAFWKMARITMADWTCTINSCQYPLDCHGSRKDFNHYYGKIPSSWIVAQQIMKCIPDYLSLCLTDQSHILSGDVSITHIAQLASKHIHVPQNGVAWRTLHRKGIYTLKDVGTWSSGRWSASLASFHPRETLPFSATRVAKAMEHWQTLKGWTVHLKLPWLFPGEQDLVLTREERRMKAENFIKAIADLQKIAPSNLKEDDRITWASDGSMIQVSAGLFDNK